MQDMTFSVSSSPHIRNEDNTRSIMLDVIIALLPTLLFAIAYAWRWRALALAAVCVVSCVVFEWLYRKLMRKTGSVHDLSAVVTGLLLAYCLPAGVPYWMPVVGSFFAVIVVKQLYGGLGMNFMNPALTARAFLVLCWPVLMKVFPKTEIAVPLWGSVPDAMTAATPLSFFNNGSLPVDEFEVTQLLLGQHSGSMGEVSVLLLLAGGAYLFIRKVITPRIPFAFLGTVAVLTFVFPQGAFNRLDFMLSHLLTGGLVLGAVFMATDYTTSPVTRGGQWVFGIGCGLITVGLRYFGSGPEGVCFAILIMNCCVWAIDKTAGPRRFGTRLFSKAKEENV
jgi:electron transport complex protein RnfD